MNEMNRGFRNISLLYFIVASGFLLGAFIFYPHVSNAAFGISPPFLNESHLVPGAHYSQTVYLVQDQPDNDVKIQTNLEVNERIRNWFVVNGGKEVIIPKGVRQFPLTIEIDVPKDAALGVYHGNLRFTAGPTTEGGQVAIALGVQIAINVTVGNDIYRNFNVALVKFLDIEEGWAPRAYVKFVNDGNVPEAFDAATFELFDNFGAVRLAYVPKSKDFPETPPFATKEYVVEFPINFHLGLGQYWASVSFYQEEKVIKSERAIFNVLKEGTLSNPRERFLRSLQDNWIYYAIGFSLFVFIIFIRMVLKRRKRRMQR
ncbi:MAG: hypothetical protein AAB652_01860 [Patescibacteria group bacterium]